jgi:CRISPR-associated protein Cas1
MAESYIRQPEKYIQQNLFEPEDLTYYSFDFPLFVDSLIKWQFNENIWYLVAPDFSYLMVSGFGVSLSKKSERLIIKDQNNAIIEIPFFKLNTVAVFSKGVRFSSDLIEQFCKNNINLSFHDFSGKPLCLMQSMYAPQRIDLKRKQLLAQTGKAGVDIAVNIVCGKISNQTALLKYFVKNIQETTDFNKLKLKTVKDTCLKMREYENNCRLLSETDNLEKIRSRLMGLEGTSARLYWKAISVLLSDKIDFEGRTHKFPKDAVNTLLNYGYGILYSQIWSAVILAGLDPYIGFLHTEQTGKPSMVFDLIEEFRAPIVDRTVYSFVMLNRDIKIVQGLLTLETRHAFSEKMLERLSNCEYYEGKKIMLSDIILMQARKVISCIEQKTNIYKSFSFKW